MTWRISQYCDPLQRELHTGRQFVVERMVLSTLRRVGFVNHRFGKQLPPEVWKIVFDHLLDHITSPYHYCTAESFPSYRIQTRLIARNNVDESDWRRIRLVCRAWAALAGPRRVLSRVTRTDVLTHGATMLRCVIYDPFDTYLFQVVDAPEASQWLTTVSIMEHAHRKSPNQPSAISLLLKAGSAVFPNVRSLSLFPSTSDSEDHVPHFWSLLESGFPLLVSLSLGYSFRGRLSENTTFPLLEILDMASTSISRSSEFTISLPSLKHLSISRVIGSDRVLEDHAHQLESLIIHGPTAEIIHYASFWNQAPNLQMLGAPLNDIAHMTTPPPGHPLRHICVYAAGDKDYLVHYKNILESFQGLSSLTIFQQQLGTLGVRSLRRLASRKGIELRQLPVLFPNKSTMWIQVATVLYIGLFMVPFSAFRLLRQSLGFRW